VACCDEQLVSIGQRARTVRLEFVAGDDFPFQLTFASNLAGYTVEADVIDPQTGSVLETFAIATEYPTINGSTATRYRLSLTRTQTAALAAHDGARWSFRRTTPDNKKRTILMGRVQPIRR